MNLALQYDRTCGCLIGGAAGDALGYPVEFSDLQHIGVFHNINGIQEYSLDKNTNLALISDDTQMTVFTAEGLLKSKKEFDNTRNPDVVINAVFKSYEDWLTGQGESESTATPYTSLLTDYPQLCSRRAPGETCLNALYGGKAGSVKNPVNDSKGCGGLMRVTPVALIYGKSPYVNVGRLAADIAALTHGHPLGYIPAAMLAFLIQSCVFKTGTNTLNDLVENSMKQTARLFSDTMYFKDFSYIISKAVKLSENDKKDIDNIADLGEGWVAEETLAIAVYCSLRYRYDFSRGIIAAVNHNGDSDSTGSVTGSILGALLGNERIDTKWKQKLELRELLLKKADEIVFN